MAGRMQTRRGFLRAFGMGAAGVLAGRLPAAPKRAKAKPLRPPADNPGYRGAFIALPQTGDPLMATFTASVVLQRLALAMSLRKMAWLDARGVVGHGVRPDVPKNVSKSITVD